MTTITDKAQLKTPKNNLNCGWGFVRVNVHPTEGDEFVCIDFIYTGNHSD